MALSWRVAQAALAIALALPLSGLPARPTPIVVGSGPLSGVIVALDPGHNGGNAAHATEIAKKVWIGNGYKPCNQVGTSTLSGYPEHAFNFDVALRVKARLEFLGAKVYMTRTTDTGYGPCVDVRGKFGESVHADLAISIHADGAATSYRGFFVMRPGLVPGYTDDILAESAVLAKAMRAGLVEDGLTIANYYAVDGLKVRTDLGTLNWSDVPIVMIELGNMKNATDAGRMKTTTGRSQYAAALVLGIRRYLER